MKSGERRADPRSPIPDLDRDLPELIKMLERLARSRVRSSEVDDVVGDALVDYVVACMEKAVAGEVVQNPRGLATTILVRQAGQQVRRRMRSRVESRDCDQIGVTDGAPHIEPETRQARDIQTFSRLGRRQRALIAGVIEGRALVEIAAQLGSKVTAAELTRVIADLVARRAQ